MYLFFRILEDIAEKGETTGYQNLSLLHAIFQMVLSNDVFIGFLSQ